MYEDDSTVDERSGRRIIGEWSRSVNLPSRGQRRRCMDLLSARCVAESVRLREPEETLWQRLTHAREVLDGIWTALAPPLALNHRWSEPPEEDRTVVEQMNEDLWRRHDPVRLHDKGYEATDYPGVDRKGLSFSAAEYLQRPWLRLAVLDWIVVDALVTGELAEYGERLKVLHLPGPSDPIERVAFDRKTKGNVEAIKREGRRYRSHPVRTFMLTQVAIPIVAVGTALWFEAYKTASVLLVLTGIEYAFSLLWLSVWAFRRMRTTPEERRTPSEQDYARFNAMMQVWRLLEGPVVNPTRLSAEMIKSTNLGAVWESAAWAIIDRAAGIDPTAWITSYPSE